MQLHTNIRQLNCQADGGQCLSGGDINNKKYIWKEVSQKGGAETKGFLFFYYTICGIGGW